MAINHAKSGDLIDLSPLSDQLSQAMTTTLVKSAALEVMRIVLSPGKVLPSHAVPGEITVQCLEGCAELTAGEQRLELRAGQLVYLAGGVRHGLTAREHTSLLVTILLTHKPG